MDFALERARTLTPDSDSEEYLLEIAWLYNRVVLTGSQIPVIDLAYELVLPEEFIDVLNNIFKQVLAIPDEAIEIT